MTPGRAEDTREKRKEFMEIYATRRAVTLSAHNDADLIALALIREKAAKGKITERPTALTEVFELFAGDAELSALEVADRFRIDQTTAFQRLRTLRRIGLLVDRDAPGANPKATRGKLFRRADTDPYFEDLDGAQMD